MKKLSFLPALALVWFTLAGKPADHAEQQCTETVKAFAKAADDRNHKALDKLLHPKFRSVTNRLFGSMDLSQMNKTAYIDLIKQGKIGGDKRVVEILSLDITAYNACVKARFTGEQLVFTTYILLVKNAEEQWQVVDDMPVVEKK